jgi:hypothetical protein
VERVLKAGSTDAPASGGDRLLPVGVLARDVNGKLALDASELNIDAQHTVDAFVRRHPRSVGRDASRASFSQRGGHGLLAPVVPIASALDLLPAGGCSGAAPRRLPR